MIVAGVECGHTVVLCGVCYIEFVGAYGRAFNADTEYLAFKTVCAVLVVDIVSEDLVERVGQTCAVSVKVYRSILKAVGYPDVVEYAVVELLADVFADLSRCDYMVDPELTDSFVVVRKGEAVCAQRMREAGRVEVELDAYVLCPVDPAVKVLAFLLVTGNRCIAVEIYGVERETLDTRDHLHCDFEVSAEFVDGAGAARIVTGGLDTARQRSRGVFETDNVVALPALDGYRYFSGLLHCKVGIYAELCVHFFCKFICFIYGHLDILLNYIGCRKYPTGRQRYFAINSFMISTTSMRPSLPALQ